MVIEIAPVPVCTDLDLSSYDGPWQHVSRFRGASGWLLVAETTIQSQHEILTTQVVTACDEFENPIPSFQARHLTECDWLNPCECEEVPPDILQDQLCEEEGALLVRWHRERNTALAEAFDLQEARVADLEGRARAFVRRNETKIAKLRQRRRHPSATPEIRSQLAAIIRELEEESDDVIAEMADTRAVIRQQAEEFEERLWQRADVLVESTPLCLVHWCSLVTSRYEPPKVPKRYSTQFIPACGRTGGSIKSESHWMAMERLAWAATMIEKNTPFPPVPPTDAAPEQEINVVEPSDDEPCPPASEKFRLGTIAKSNDQKILARLQRERADLDKRITSMKAVLVEMGPSSRPPPVALRLEKALRASRELDRKLGFLRNSLGVDAEGTELSTAEIIEDYDERDAPDQAGTPWTPERVQLLDRLWRVGRSASEIAQTLGGTSRNAVVNKAERLGLPFRNAGPEHKAEPSSAFSPIDGGKAVLALDSEISRLKERRSALEVEGRKFFSGSTKYERNRAERIELTREIDRLVKRTAIVRCNLKAD